MAMEYKRVKDIMEAYASVYAQPEKEIINEAGMDVFSTPAVKKAQTASAVKFYTTPLKPLPPYQAKTPRFPALTVPDFDLGSAKPKPPVFGKDDGRTEKPKTEKPRTEKPRNERPAVKPPVAVNPPKKETVTPSVAPTEPKTPNPLMVDMPKGPGSMAAPEKPLTQTTTPRTPISPGSFGGGVGTKPTGMSAGTSTVQGLDRPITSGLTTRSQDEIQKKNRERSALSRRVAGYKSGGPSAGVREGVETDLFDYLLEYLVAEGYADTNKAALAIMANMSEEWKQSIVEADSVAAMRERAAKRRQQRYKGGPGGRDDFRPYTKDDYDNSKPGYGSGASSQAKDT